MSSNKENGPGAERLGYSAAELASLTGLSTQAIYRLIRTEKIPYTTIGPRRYLIPAEYVEQIRSGSIKSDF